MSDIHLNSNFEVEIDDGGDLKQVSGVERVRQSVAVHVEAETQDLVGEVYALDTKYRSRVRRAIRNHPLLPEVEDISITEVVTEDNVYEIEVSVPEETINFIHEL